MAHFTYIICCIVWLYCNLLNYSINASISRVYFIIMIWVYSTLELYSWKKEGKFLSKSQKIRDQQYYLDRCVILQTKQRKPQVELQGVLKWIKESKSIHTFPQSKNEKNQLIYISRKRNGRSIQKIRKATEQINQVSLFLRIQQYIYSNKTKLLCNWKRVWVLLGPKP